MTRYVRVAAGCMPEHTDRYICRITTTAIRYPKRVPNPFTLMGINKQAAKKPAATRN